MRVLVCGGRDYRDRALVFLTLDKLLIPDGEMMPVDRHTIIHGDCRRGADLFADDWAVVNWVEVEPYRPNWAMGRAAGVLRNERMLRDSKPHLVVAFPGGAGTNDMIHRARRAGVEIMMVGWDEA